MAITTKDTLSWIEVDTDSLTPSLKERWGKYKKLMDEAKLAKDDFEDLFITTARKSERIETDMSLAFGYRFGKLSIARVDPKAEKAKASAKPKFAF
jgi:hypothetical protein